MNLSQAQPSAFAKSIGLYLTVIQDMSENMKHNFEMQAMALNTESKATGSMAQAAQDSMNAEAASMQDQAYGLLASGAIGIAAGAASGFMEWNNAGETKKLSGQIDTLEENEKLFTQVETAEPDVQAQRKTDTENMDTSIRNKRAQNLNKASAENTKMNLNDVTAARTNEAEYNAAKERVKTQKERLVAKRKEIMHNVETRQGQFQTVGQAAGSVAKAINDNAAASEKISQGQHQAEQMIWKYYGDANKAMADTDAQSVQTLVQSGQAALQNLEAIVRSNQPS